MMIDKNNYEAYLLDYLEGTISDKDKQLLHAFLDDHPELKSDLETDVSLTIQPEKADAGCNIKESLLKHPAQAFDMPVADYLLIKQAEDGLSSSEKAELLLAEPNQKTRTQAAAAYSQVYLSADTTILYQEKRRLRRFQLFPAIRQVTAHRGIAAIASVAILLSVWMGSNHLKTTEPIIAKSDVQKTQPTLSHPASVQTEAVQTPAIKTTTPVENTPLKEPSEYVKEQSQTAEPDKPGRADFQEVEPAQYLATRSQIKGLEHQPINGYEHGLNVLMPQYMNNNLVQAELASIYQQISEEEKKPSSALALLEGGVKVMNFLSKEPVEMNKYYNADGKVVGYQLKGENIELNRRLK
ncbi:hypothetical protein [Carboxylicivirga taeanensis]|uniref:hypothetical protein n=1 Tax=Carboxylicivirga taeanensis TaxID=1416875 RepID=UPI003F6DE845